MAWDLGHIVIKNVSGGPLRVLGHMMSADEEIDLMDADGPMFRGLQAQMWGRLRNPDAAQPEDSLGRRYAAQQINVVRFHPENRRTWNGPPPGMS